MGQGGSVLLLTLPLILLAQVDSTASLRGHAKSSFNGALLAGVMISIPAARQFAVTDETGAFWMTGLPAGTQKIRISYEGRDTKEFEVTLQSHGTRWVNVLLDVAATDLDPIVVEAKALNRLPSFFERKKYFEGFGRFFTREDIERLRPLAISDLLRRDGIWIRCNPECVPTRMHRGSLCSIPVIVNGLPFWDFDFDNIAVTDVLGVEVYRGSIVGDPLGLSPRSLVGTGDARTYEPFRPRGSCGSIYIWTR
jgi:carboxypeptidase-like protein